MDTKKYTYRRVVLIKDGNVEIPIKAECMCITHEIEKGLSYLHYLEPVD